MRAGCMYGAPHIKNPNAQSSDGTFGSKHANEATGLRSFDSEDTRIEIQRSMSVHEREKHVRTDNCHSGTLRKPWGRGR